MTRAKSFIEYMEMGEKKKTPRWERKPEKEHRFKVNEYSSGYMVEDTETGDEVWMGDGVDVFDDDSRLEVGTEEFRKSWEDMLNMNPDETLEAYFPEQYDKETGGEQ
jgi:hypothetical protein